MTQTFENNIALITGVARGIGRAAALILWDRGARVVATDINETVHELAGDSIVTLAGSIADEEVHGVVLRWRRTRSAASTSSSTMPGAR